LMIMNNIVIILLEHTQNPFEVNLSFVRMKYDLSIY
jgi:hypothetical protein